MLSIFIKNDVRFLIVGAYALGAYIAPRSTGDIDFWIEPTKTNAQKTYAALAEFGAPLQSLKIEDLEKPGTIFQIGLPPFRIDVITKISGVNFENAWADRVTHPVLNIQVSIISKKYLIQNKRAAGRPKDLLDLDLLLKS